MKRFFTLCTIVAVVAAIVWGILWLEDMRQQSAQEARENTQNVLGPEG